MLIIFFSLSQIISKTIKIYALLLLKWFIVVPNRNYFGVRRLAWCWNILPSLPIAVNHTSTAIQHLQKFIKSYNRSSSRFCLETTLETIVFICLSLILTFRTKQYLNWIFFLTLAHGNVFSLWKPSEKCIHGVRLDRFQFFRFHEIRFIGL